GGRPQSDLPRHHQRRAGVDTNAELDDSPARVQDPLRRPPTRVNRLHRKSDALQKHGIQVRVIDGRAYELNGSLPYVCSIGSNDDVTHRRIEMISALSAFVPGWCICT